ncbi:hypothetical protein [Nostoc sp.]|uniref:hypothetical protein n=1 Tax=Nostoc sp. TaxID=1180 RepID=UPI002FFBE696
MSKYFLQIPKFSGEGSDLELSDQRHHLFMGLYHESLSVIVYFGDSALFIILSGECSYQDMFLGAVGFLSCFLGLHLHKLVGSHLVGNA